jgi:hypothetical protein
MSFFDPVAAVVIVRGWLVLGHPGAAALATVVAAPQARSGIVLL